MLKKIAKKEAESFHDSASFGKFAFAAVSATLLIATGITTKAEAADFSFRGTFSADDDVQLFNFTVGSTSSVTLKTLSYAGGTQADSTVIAAGGFDPILALFDGSGNFIANNDDGFFPDVGIDPTTGVTFDTFLQATLNPGNYTVAVSQFDNFFNGSFGDNISQGFLQQGNPNFNGGFGGGSRTNEWAFDVLDVDSATAVPEPFTILGAGTALGFGTFFKRKLAKKPNKNS